MPLGRRSVPTQVAKFQLRLISQCAKRRDMTDATLITDLPPKEFSKALRDGMGLSASYASELVSGKRSPSLALAVRIEDRLGIPTSFWVRRDEP